MPVVPGNIESRGMEFQKTTPISVFSCFDLDICRTNLDFCNERRKVCEKCEDYEYTCGKNIQPVGCTKYCVDLLVAKKLQEERQKSQHNLMESEGAKTNVTTEKPPESIEKSKTHEVTLIIIISIMVISIIVLVVFIVYREKKRKQSATKEVPETQLGLLGKDVETPVESSLAYSSVPIQDDKADVTSPVPSAPSISQETFDPDQTKPKMNRNRDKCVPSAYQGPKIGDLHLGRQQQVDKAFSEIQQREEDFDEPTSSGYNSAFSTPTVPRSESTIINNTISINWNPNAPNHLSTSASEETTVVEDPNKNIPFGKQESGKMESAMSLSEVLHKNQVKPDLEHCHRLMVFIM
ncbi:hypothetical protein ACJMK2_023284 [Sinanodonta woodiana]|uniref:Uncharacterized protein n=1 Tax=Sinanodonta woodiana TaxID=1069815 RepID=A0ABD3T5C9_SINWO